MARQNKFKVGDIVVLRSSSASMTVIDFPGEVKQTYTCCWFDYNKEKQFGIIELPEDALELVK